MKLKIRSLYQAGFTLMELTIYMALMSVLIVVISRIFIASLDAQLHSEAISSVDQDGKYLFSRLMYSISSADDVLLPAVPGESSDSLILRKDGVNTLYELSGQEFMITDDIDSQQLNSAGTHVSDLSFTRIGNGSDTDTIRVYLRLESVATEERGPQVKEFQTTIGLR